MTSGHIIKFPNICNMKFNGFGMIRSFQDYIETETLIYVQHKLEVPPTTL